MQTTELPEKTELPETTTITVECGACVMQGSRACTDCVVSYVLDREPDDAVVIDAGEARAMRMLEQAGLLPMLRFVDRAG